MPRMHVLLFDIDGTLLSSGGAGRNAMERAIEAAFRVPASSEGVPMSGRTDRSITRDLFRCHAIAETPENWQLFIRAYLELLPRSLAEGKGRPLPGIAGLLAALAPRTDVALGLLTGNYRDGARTKLGHFGLYDYFAFGGFGDEHWDRDDVAREALAATCTHLRRQIQPEEMWVIGDTPLDIRCARAIGARVAAVATGTHSVEQLAADEPDLVFADLRDPAPLLHRLVA